MRMMLVLEEWLRMGSDERYHVVTVELSLAEHQT